jgi:hypothetical protein
MRLHMMTGSVVHLNLWYGRSLMMRVDFRTFHMSRVYNYIHSLRLFLVPPGIPGYWRIPFQATRKETGRSAADYDHDGCGAVDLIQ